MSNQEEVTRLQAELLVAQALLDQARAATKHTIVRPLTETLRHEKRRSERYNHYFSVLLLRSPKLDHLQLARAASATLRATDVLGVLDGSGDHHVFDTNRESVRASADALVVEGAEAVVAVLPETDKEGVQVAVNRLRVAFTADDQVTAGYAVYPDDSTDTDELISIAAA